MNKFLLASLLLVSASSFAQYSEDFEGTAGTALPAGWSQETNATDGGYITTTDYSSEYFDIPAHTRYAGTNDDICNCDKLAEKLISSSYLVPAGNNILSFEYVLGAYEDEYANIGISTDGGATVIDLGTLAATNDSGPHVWTAWTADISTYAGQTINLVWNYSDYFGWGTGLMIDDVEIYAASDVEMEMTSLIAIPLVAAGNVTIEGTVTSLGGANITSIDVVWDDGGTPNSQTFSVDLDYGDTYNFTHSTQLTAVAGTNYNLDVCVDASSDADANNDCLATSFSTVSSLVSKIIVGELITGEWCPWCPRGIVALAEMAISNPNDFIGIAVHNNDGMAFPSYDNGILSYISTGYPSAGVDRIVEADPSTFASMHADRASMVPPASVSASGTVFGNTLSVTATADFVGPLTGDYRLAVVLLEDNVTGAFQNNNYEGGVDFLQNPDGGSMPNFDWMTGGNPVIPVYHDHVARALGDDEINGAAGSLPASVNDGDSESHAYTFTKDPSWKMDDMRIVAMLVNGNTGEILNAGLGSFLPNECPADEFGGPYPVDVYDPLHPCELCVANPEAGATWEPYPAGDACPDLVFSHGFE